MKKLRSAKPKGKRKKPTLVKLVAQVLAITSPDKLKKKDIFWKAEISKADAAVYAVLTCLEHRSLYCGFGLKERPLSIREIGGRFDRCAGDSKGIKI